MKNKVLSMIMALVMIVTCLVSPAMATPAETNNIATPTGGDVMQPTAVDANGEDITGTAISPNEEVEIFVAVDEGQTVFTQTSDLELAAASMDSQLAGLYAAENTIEAATGMNIEDAEYFSLVINGFAFIGEAWMVDAINDLDNGMVAAIAPRYELVEPESEESIDLTPNMDKATDLTGTIKAWDLGYTGKGTAIAVIDTGIKQTHEAFAVAPEDAKITKESLKEVFEKYGSLMHGKFPENAYYSAKLPYNWDYPYADADPTHDNSAHGSHVAGIAAGNNGGSFKGMAPDAQIITLKVFDKNGSCSLADLLSAMEDSVYLGVDVINMSLGIAAGFEGYDWLGHGAVYEALEKAGVAVCASAGNDGHAYYSTAYGYWANNERRWLSTNPDNGMIGNPGTYAGSFTVANSNSVSKSKYYQIIIAGINNTKYLYPSKDPNTPFLGDMAAGDYDLVNAGKATAEDLAAAGDLTGKIALIAGVRDQLDAQCAAAVEAGAMAIVLGAVAGTQTSNTTVFSTVPLAVMSSSDVTYFAKKMVDNKTTLKINKDFKFSSVSLHTSSSWGPTANLKLKPDITAPGTSIVSVEGLPNKGDNEYVAMTGTSMSSPAVAGGVLVMKQYLKTVFPNATDKELYEIAYNLMMSTANQINGFVRQQGAGLIDLEKATKSTAYLTTVNDTRPKLELDDSATGEFAISFKVHNFGTTDKTYTISHKALTESTSTLTYSGYVSPQRDLEYAKRTNLYPWLHTPEELKVIKGTQKDVTGMVTLEGEKDITVKAGETVTVNLTLKAGEDLMQYFQDTCPAGMYLEGWIKLADTSAENAVDLSIPFLGFVGDWDYPAIIDEGWWWQRPYGENNLAQFYNSNMNGGIYVGYDAPGVGRGLGLNPYWDEVDEDYVADRNAISPNGDGRMDAVNTLEFSLLRLPRQVKITLQDAEGNVLETLYNYRYGFRREYHSIGIDTHRLSYSGLTFDYAMDGIEENETVCLVTETWLDHDEFQIEDNKLAKIVVPFTKDLTAPSVTAVDGGVEIMDTNYVAYYAVYTDAWRTDLVFEDGVFATERGVKETYMTDMDKYFVAVADYAQNEAFYYVEDGKAYVLDGEGFDHGRTIVAHQWWDVANYTATFVYDNMMERAWVYMDSELNEGLQYLTEPVTGLNNEYGTSTGGYNGFTGTAITADGKAYVATADHLYTFDPATMQVDLSSGKRFTESGNGNMIWLENLFAAPGTNDLYAWMDLGGGRSCVCKVNPETAVVTRMWELKNGGTSGYHAVGIKDADTVIAFQAPKMVLDEFNLLTGAKEATTDMGLYKQYSSEVGVEGYTWSLLYDNQENRVYISGLFGAFGKLKDQKGGIIMYDLDDSAVKFHVVGAGDGHAVFGMYFLDEFVNLPKQEHICYIKETVAPTCTTEGYTLKVCAECGEEIKENVTEAKGHDYEAVVTEPTCTEGGYTTYTCKVCGYSYVGDETAALGHDYEAVVTAPTCTTLGYTTYTCKNCGDSYKDDYTPTTDHKYGKWETVTAPTCNTKGQEKRTCECGAAQYRDTDMTGHNYKAEVTAPTCTTLGYTTYTCTVCGDSYKSDFVETIGHKYSEEVVAPTCTEMGYTIFTCHCGHRYEGNFVAPTGHKFGEWTVTKEATCVENGEETRTCACGETETRATPKADHVFEDVVTAPTCTEVGYTNHVCTVCGHNYITDLTQPTGHDYEATVTAPTCTEDGYTTYTCTVCGESYVDDIVPATGHTFGEWVLTTEPGCTEAGEETRYCADCDATETREVAPICPAEKFSDVDTKQWYHEGVCYVIRNGLMNGKSETVFAPTANLTRAELVTVLYRMAGSPSVEDLEHPFTDVADDTWYTDAVIWAYNAEVVKGISDTAFAPAANITREQIATILYRYAGAEAIEEDALADFADADKVSDWAVEAMNWAVSVGLINGMDDTTLAPQGNATRAQIATILMRYCEG